MIRKIIITIISFFILATPGIVFAQGETTVSLLPESSKRLVGENFALEIKLASSEKILGADIDIAYDPQILEVQKITPADFFNNPQILTNKIDPAAGVINLSIFSYPTKQASATIAIVTFKALRKTEQPTELTFEPTTVLATVGEKKIQFKTVFAKVEISEKTAVAVPSLVLLPTTNPSPAPFLTPTPTPVPEKPGLVSRLVKPLGSLFVLIGIVLSVFALVIL